MRPRVIMVLAVAAIALGGTILVPAASARITGGRFDLSTLVPPPKVTPAPPAAPKPPTLAPAPVRVDVGTGNYVAWALLDRETGAIAGSANSASATNSTESMIKVWLVSDYLRRTTESGAQPTKTRLAQASTAIRDSNDDAAQSLFVAGGGAPVIERMIKICRLTDTESIVPPGKRTVWWSYTQMSAQDAVRLGECVKEGTAAGPTWTKWVLTEMTKVRGTTADKDQHLKTGGGRWGIIDGLPLAVRKQSPVSIKNGWTLLNYDGKWHVNCLAVTDAWVLAVQTRYPGGRGLDYGANVCESVTAQLVTPQPGAALKVPPPAVKS